MLSLTSTTTANPSGPDKKIKTRFMIFSDTHGLGSSSLSASILEQDADVVLHCGDLTDDSRLDEFKSSIRFLKSLKAPLKLVIAGNHDFTMDPPAFESLITETQSKIWLDGQLVKRTYASYETVKRLFNENGIIFLDEGYHSFRLQNGALLNIYASPYTPSYGVSGFQYCPDRGHEFIRTEIDGTSTDTQKVDVVMTHGPPMGVLDVCNSGSRVGCPHLFKAIARSKPLIHCFGHIHEGWGGKLLAWRQDTSASKGLEPSHFTEIDNEKSLVIEKLSTLVKTPADGNIKKIVRFATTSHCSSDSYPLNRGAHTLFINAAIKGSGDLRIQPPWLVDVDLTST